MRPSFGDSLETAVDAIQQGTDGEIKDAIGDSNRARTREVKTLHRRGQSRDERWTRTRFGRWLSGAESPPLETPLIARIAQPRAGIDRSARLRRLRRRVNTLPPGQRATRRWRLLAWLQSRALRAIWWAAYLEDDARLHARCSGLPGKCDW